MSILRALIITTTTLALSGCATPNDQWTDADTKRQWAATALIVVDSAQTGQFQYVDRQEGNLIARELIGPRPSVEQALVSGMIWAGVNYLIARRLEPKWRRRLQWMTIGGHSATIVWNCYATDIC